MWKSDQFQISYMHIVWNNRISKMTVLKKKKKDTQKGTIYLVLRINLRLFHVFLHSSLSMTKLIIAIPLNKPQLFKSELKSYLSIMAQIKSHTPWETFSRRFSSTLYSGLILNSQSCLYLLVYLFMSEKLLEGPVELCNFYFNPQPYHSALCMI